MGTVTIPINTFHYVFRKLTFEEELALEVKQGEDGARAVLSEALVEVSAFSINGRSDARKVIGTLPSTVIERIWIMYKARLPADRFFTARGLYLAPEPATLVRQNEEDHDARESASDRAIAALEQRFGHSELAEEREASQRLLEDARRRGVLTTVSAGSIDG